MPIYEYQCRACNHHFEAMRKVSEGPPEACPSCGADALQKLVSRVAFRLKGTGWYETDFKNKPGEKKSGDGDAAGDGKKQAEKKSDAAADKKSDTKKPAAKTES